MKIALIVDDNPDTRELYQLYLEAAGFRVLTAWNGLEAVTRATVELPQVIVMDRSLPLVDGWEATRRLKADPRTREIPIIGLTGGVAPGVEQQARAAGCEHFMTKPCLPRDLVDQVRAILRGHMPPQHPDPALPHRRTLPTSRPKRRRTRPPVHH